MQTLRYIEFVKCTGGSPPIRCPAGSVRCFEKYYDHLTSQPKHLCSPLPQTCEPSICFNGLLERTLVSGCVRSTQSNVWFRRFIPAVCMHSLISEIPDLTADSTHPGTARNRGK
jgi:hypothetical protein